MKVISVAVLRLWNKIDSVDAGGACGISKNQLNFLCYYTKGNDDKFFTKRLKD